MTDQLKPCPFCGSEAVLRSVHIPNTDREGWTVQCEDCGVSIRPMSVYNDAINHWNHRVWIPPDDYADAKIGDIVECDGVKLKVVEDRYHEMNDCERYCYFFGDKRCELMCCGDREDGIPVYFQKMEESNGTD